MRKAIPILWLGACLSAGLLGCGGADREDTLLNLPAKFAAQVREGQIDDAVECLADEFEAEGLSRAGIAMALRRFLEGRKPFVVHVGVLGDPGADRRRLIVLGVLGPASMDSARPGHLRPFRVEAEVRADGNDWKVTAARHEQR